MAGLVRVSFRQSEGSFVTELRERLALEVKKKLLRLEGALAETG